MPEYIEREALIEAVANVKMRDVVPNCDELAIKKALCKQGQALKKIVKDFPAADVEVVRHGYWIMHTNSDGNLNHYECSVCHRQQGYLSNYCEDCGAKMDGKGGGE